MAKYTPMYKPSGAGPMLVVEGDEKRYEDMGWTRDIKSFDLDTTHVILQLNSATKDYSLDDLKALSKSAILDMLPEDLQDATSQELLIGKAQVVADREQEIRDAD